MSFTAMSSVCVSGSNYYNCPIIRKLAFHSVFHIISCKCFICIFSARDIWVLNLVFAIRKTLCFVLMWEVSYATGLWRKHRNCILFHLTFFGISSKTAFILFPFFPFNYWPYYTEFAAGRQMLSRKRHFEKTLFFLLY